VPPITTCMLGTGTADGPFGAKGIGEHVMVAAAPAIANAIHAATGVVVRELPITAEKLYAALQQIGAEQGTLPAANEDRG
jgi:aldehyde oxidoreductase